MTAESNADLSRQRYLALQGAARVAARPTDELMSIYVLEGFLARLGISKYRPQLVLKGGMLLAAFTERRATRDIDLQAVQLANDVDTVRSVVTEVASVAYPDGVEFDLATSSADAIREDDEYSGVRVSMDARLHTAQLKLKVDVNVGDPIWPEPIEIEVPSILKADHSIRVMGYPLPMVFAEKIITAIARGIASTRWRDFADVILLSSSNQIAGEELKGALDEVARHRHVELQPLRQVLDGYPTIAQHRWDRWLQRQGLGDRIPSDFAEVLESVFEFADPALDDLVGDSIWIPNVGWTAG